MTLHEFPQMHLEQTGNNNAAKMSASSLFP